MIQYYKNFDDEHICTFFIQPQSDPPRGQVQFCHNKRAPKTNIETYRNRFLKSFYRIFFQKPTSKFIKI